MGSDPFAVAAPTCTRRIQFCSGHRLLNHESKCAHLHGHNYVAFITCQAAKLDEVGRVIDFSCIKEAIGGWIDQNWDHGFILHREDPNVLMMMSADLGRLPQTVEGAVAKIRAQKLYLMDRNPTAENMAAYLLYIGNQLLEGYGVKVVKVVLFETENCYAEVTAEGK
jgi:6-pyruvoyltetrahydropterin/6-carboxytetrahydropterin synthase